MNSETTSLVEKDSVCVDRTSVMLDNECGSLEGMLTPMLVLTLGMHGISCMRTKTIGKKSKEHGAMLTLCFNKTET